MKLMQAVADIDTKRMVRIAWVAQLGLLTAATIVMAFACPERLADWQGPLGILTGATVLEGGAAAGGASLKRFSEGYVEKRRGQNGEPAA